MGKYSFFRAWYIAALVSNNPGDFFADLLESKLKHTPTSEWIQLLGNLGEHSVWILHLVEFNKALPRKNRFFWTLPKFFNESFSHIMQGKWQLIYIPIVFWANQVFLDTKGRINVCARMRGSQSNLGNAMFSSSPPPPPPTSLSANRLETARIEVWTLPGGIPEIH